MKDAKLTGVYGGRGQGKSTFVKALLRGQKRVVVFDVMAEYDVLPGFKVAHDLKSVYRLMKSKSFRIAYQPPLREYPADLCLHELCDFLLQMQRPYKEGRGEKLLLVVEEMSKSAPNEKMLKGQRAFIEVIDRGRHYGIEVIGVSQRVKSVLVDYRNNSAEEVFFRIHDHSEVAHIDSKLPPAWRGKVQELQPHHYIKVAGRDIFFGKNRL